ncbi:MAG: hypothetical protein AAF184_25550 [Pseudomonadota bacterium]
MAIFPVIESPCPLKSRLRSHLDSNDVCRLCHRQVVDLTPMSDDERRAFVSGCEGPTCVRYSLPLKEALVASLASAALSGVPAAAQEFSPGPAAPDPLGALVQAEDVIDCDDWEDIVVISAGGINTSPDHAVEYVDTAEDLEIPELPVTFEDSASGGLASEAGDKHTKRTR